MRPSICASLKALLTGRILHSHPSTSSLEAITIIEALLRYGHESRLAHPPSCPIAILPNQPIRVHVATLESTNGQRRGERTALEAIAFLRRCSGNAGTHGRFPFHNNDLRIKWKTKRACCLPRASDPPGIGYLTAISTASAS